MRRHSRPTHQNGCVIDLLNPTYNCIAHSAVSNWPRHFFYYRHMRHLHQLDVKNAHHREYGRWVNGSASCWGQLVTVMAMRDNDHATTF